MDEEDIFADDEHEEPSDEWDSGPFCRHWSDPADCELVCSKCGHGCSKHEWDGCIEEGCDCNDWVE